MTTATVTEAAQDELDQLLLNLASTEKVQQVTGQTGGALQSHTARAWTMGGQVD